MGNYKSLIGDLICGLVGGRLSISDAEQVVMSADIDELDRKGLLSLLLGTTFVSVEDTVEKLKVLGGSNSFKRVALFEKVSEEQYVSDMLGHNLINVEDKRVLDWYKAIELPRRGTKGSAGYDFICPVDISLKPGEELVVCSGIRCMMKENWVLKVYPRSSSGTKYRVQFNNTVPILDSDYYYADNEGHIMFKIINDGREGKVFELKKGEKLCQGIFVEYGITFDDDVSTERTGGFGSTGK